MHGPGIASSGNFLAGLEVQAGDTQTKRCGPTSHSSLQEYDDLAPSITRTPTLRTSASSQCDGRLAQLLLRCRACFGYTVRYSGQARYLVNCEGFVPEPTKIRNLRRGEAPNGSSRECRISSGVFSYTHAAGVCLVFFPPVLPKNISIRSSSSRTCFSLGYQSPRNLSSAAVNPRLSGISPRSITRQ